MVKQASPAYMRLSGITNYFSYIFKGSGIVDYRRFGCVCNKCMDHDYNNCLNVDICGALRRKEWNVSLNVNEYGIPIIPKKRDRDDVKRNENNMEIDQLPSVPQLSPLSSPSPVILPPDDIPSENIIEPSIGPNDIINISYNNMRPPPRYQYVYKPPPRNPY